jgi:hypothetical protein
MPKTGQPEAVQRFTLTHLVVWVAACAVQAAVFRSLDPSAVAYGKENFGVPVALWFSWITLSGGTAIAGLILLAKRRLANTRFPLEPGDYLWIAQGVEVGLSLWMGIAWNLRWSPSFVPVWTLWLSIVPAISYGAAALIVFLGLSTERDIGRWRAGLKITGAVTAIRAIYHLGISLVALRIVIGLGPPLSKCPEWPLPVLSGLAVGWLALDDLVGRRNPPWSHWVGVSLWLFRTIGYTLLRLFI